MTEIDKLFAGRDLPPHTSSELVATRVDSLERRVAALEQLLALHVGGELQASDALLPHRLASVDRLLDAGLITWEHAHQRKRDLIERAGYEALDVTVNGGKPDFVYVMRGTE